MITREEWLEKMQSLRQKQNDNAMMSRLAFDNLEDEYRQRKQSLFNEYESRKREIRDKRTQIQKDIENQMHELKVQWAKEHPIEEVKIVDEQQKRKSIQKTI